jgi:hypothetical protein
MFAGIWAKLVALLGAAVAILLAVIGYKNRKIDDLEEENAGHVIKDDISEQMKEATEVIKKEAENDKKNHDSADWRDRI